MTLTRFTSALSATASRPNHPLLAYRLLPVLRLCEMIGVRHVFRLVKLGALTCLRFAWASPRGTKVWKTLQDQSRGSELIDSSQELNNRFFPKVRRLGAEKTSALPAPGSSFAVELRRTRLKGIGPRSLPDHARSGSRRALRRSPPG